MKVTNRNDLGVAVEEIRIQDISREDAKRLVDLTHHEKLVVIQGQEFDEEEYVRFSRLLGEPQIYLQSNYHHPDWPEIFVSSSVPKDGKKFGVRGTGRYWHTDYAFMPEPLSLTMVTPRIIPKASRGTLYIDMERVYEALPARLRAMADQATGIHEAKWRYKIQPSDIDRSIIDIVEECERLAPAVHHPVVITHPVTGRRALYLSRGFTTGFVGMSAEEGRDVLNEFLSFIEQDQFVMAKRWEAGEVLLWDNRVLLHRAAHSDVTEANLSYRIGVYDGWQFYAPDTRSLQPQLEARDAVGCI